MESVVPSSRARSIGRRASRSRCYSNKESRRFISRTPSHLSFSSPSRPSLSVLRKFRRNVEPLYEIAPPAIYMRSSYGARGRLKVRECRPRVHREIGEGRGRFARGVYGRIPSLVPSADSCRSPRERSRFCSLLAPFEFPPRARARARAEEIRDPGVITFIVLSIAPRSRSGNEPSRRHENSKGAAHVVSVTRRASGSTSEGTISGSLPRSRSRPSADVPAFTPAVPGTRSPSRWGAGR